MNYTLEIVINLPRDKVVELFDNPDNLKHWQPVVRVEHLDGEPGQPGARSRMIYKLGKREREMIETITVRNFPEEFSGHYETAGGTSKMRNRFIDLDGKRTRWVSEVEFVCHGLLLKLMGFLMPGAFRRQSYKFMENFKSFAESR